MDMAVAVNKQSYMKPSITALLLSPFAVGDIAPGDVFSHPEGTFKPACDGAKIVIPLNRNSRSRLRFHPPKVWRQDCPEGLRSDA